MPVAAPGNRYDLTFAVRPTARCNRTGAAAFQAQLQPDTTVTLRTLRVRLHQHRRIALEAAPFQNVRQWLSWQAACLGMHFTKCQLPFSVLVCSDNAWCEGIGRTCHSRQWHKHYKNGIIFGTRFMTFRVKEVSGPLDLRCRFRDYLIRSR
jgi:hypothetical protein